jgi:hypothetical protein
MARFHSFGLFVEASGRWGVTSMTSAAVLLIVGIVEHLRDKNFTGFGFVVFAFLCLGWGCYLAWNDEHKKLETEIAKNVKPRFTADIIESVRDVSVDKEDFGRTLIAKVSIVNWSDAPSTIRSVYVTMPDHDGVFPASEYGSARLHTRVATSFPQGLGIVESTVPLERKVVDVLPRMTSTSHEKGTHVDGWLKFPDVPYAFKGIRPKFFLVDGYGDTHGPFFPENDFSGGLIQ